MGGVIKLSKIKAIEIFTQGVAYYPKALLCAECSCPKRIFAKSNRSSPWPQPGGPTTRSPDPSALRSTR